VVLLFFAELSCRTYRLRFWGLGGLRGEERQAVYLSSAKSRLFHHYLTLAGLLQRVKEQKAS
jgi:hypothetical protein